jgi:MFS family permease
MTGIVVSGIGIGTVIMPPIASWLISNYGWRHSYLIVGIIALALIVGVAQLIKREPDQIEHSPFAAGRVRQDITTTEVAGFSLWKAISTRQFWIFSGAVSSMFFCQQIMIVHMVSYATDLEITEIIAASILSVIGGLSIVGRVGVGGVCDRIGNRLSLLIVLALLSVALFWLLLAKELWMFYLFAVVFGFSYGGLVALNTPITAELFGLRSIGAILGMVIFISSVGGALGPIVASCILDINGSYQLVFRICAGASVAGLILAVLLRPPRREGLTSGMAA